MTLVVQSEELRFTEQDEFMAVWVEPIWPVAVKNDCADPFQVCLGQTTGKRSFVGVLRTVTDLSSDIIELERPRAACVKDEVVIT